MAQQINQGATVTVTAPCLQLGTVTTNSGHFDGPSITVAEAASSLPYTFTDPVGWTIVIDGATAEAAATFTVTVPLTATVSDDGGYNLSYYDGDGNYYSQWFDVILENATPVTPTIPQVMQGATGTLTIPLISLTYKSKFISIDSPEEGTWLDDGNQTLPYLATFSEAPAPTGWSFVLTAYDASTLSYTATVTVPSSYKFGTYIVTLSTGSGHIYESEFEVIPAPPGVEIIPACDCINGFDIVSEVQVRLRESQSTTAQEQSMLYLRHVRRVLDDIARRTWEIYDSASRDIIANQPQYVMPHRPYELRTMTANDGNGNIFTLTSLTEEEANNKFFNWQNTTQDPPFWSGVPSYFVDFGTNTFWLLPVPNYNCQFGLTAGGYFGVDKWYTLDMCLPLPEGYDELVVLGVAWRRCLEMKVQDPLYAQMEADYKNEYETLIRRHYREALRKVGARRNMIPSNRSRISWGQGWSWSGG